MKFGISYMIKLFMMTKKINREEVYNKCEGHCGYCGKEITIKQMQVDHIKPLYRNDKVTTLEVWGVERGSDNFDNLMPSCARCKSPTINYIVIHYNFIVFFHFIRYLYNENNNK